MIEPKTEIANIKKNEQDPTKLPGKEINWDEFQVDAEPEEDMFDMFKLSKEEFDAL